MKNVFYANLSSIYSHRRCESVHGSGRPPRPAFESLPKFLPSPSPFLAEFFDWRLTRPALLRISYRPQALPSPSFRWLPPPRSVSTTNGYHHGQAAGCWIAPDQKSNGCTTGRFPHKPRNSRVPCDISNNTGLNTRRAFPYAKRPPCLSASAVQRVRMETGGFSWAKITLASQLNRAYRGPNSN